MDTEDPLRLYVHKLFVLCSLSYQKKPSDIVNIRAIETVAYQVIDTETNEVLEKIEESKAFFQVLSSVVLLIIHMTIFGTLF